MSTPTPDHTTTTPAEGVTIHHGDCLDVLRAMPAESVHAVVTDPPYGLSNTGPDQVAETITRWASGDREYLPGGAGFMGHEWDGFVPPVAVWDECLRVLKPGGHLLAFAGARTHDLMTLGIRLAGFEIRDSLAWLHSQGFPKSLDVAKAMDRTAGADRGIPRSSSSGGKFGFAGRNINGVADSTWRCEACGRSRGSQSGNCQCDKRGEPQTATARQWEGWGTALKPAFEPVTLARKPLAGTVAANVLEHGTGALNIDACRIGTERLLNSPAGNPSGAEGTVAMGGHWRDDAQPRAATGRWPANVVLDESQAAELDRQVGPVHWQATNNTRKSSGWGVSEGKARRQWDAPKVGAERLAKEGPGLGPSKFFYVAKAGRRERPEVDGVKHPTVKPLALMRHLCRLVTPPGGVILEPFAGSGTTVEAAMLEGFDVVGIEREAEYLPLIGARVQRALEARAREARETEVRLF